MNYTSSKLWQTLPANLSQRLELCLQTNYAPNKKAGQIFFRADDIGVPGQQFSKMIDIFSKHQVPLNLAVVPSWLTSNRWRQLLEITKDNDQLWCWHQHGRSHTNHQTHGKKGEFGSCRTIEQLRYDLSQGKERLKNLLQSRFTPVFTPPWNRCSADTLMTLEDLGFKAISRSSGKLIASPVELPDYPVNIDLHTRKEVDPATGWDNLFAELQKGMAAGYCGIMLHHQRMNSNAYNFLDTLLLQTRKIAGFELLNFTNMIK